MKLNKLIAIATISLLSGGISMAQKALNLEDIVAGNIIQTKGIGSMTWLKDGERYSRLEIISKPEARISSPIERKITPVKSLSPHPY